MADGTPTANYGWTKPSLGASVDVWGGELNSSLDGIDSTVYSIQTSVPAASSATPAMDGTAAAGAATAFARGDHVHPVDTSRYAASNPSGYQTAAQVTASLGPYALIASSVASISMGATGLTPAAATTGAVTVAGTLKAVNGGTGLATIAANQALYGSAANVISAGTLPVLAGGTGVTTKTGTGSTVGSVSPTFTGTLTCAALTANGVVTGTGVGQFQTLYGFVETGTQSSVSAGNCQFAWYDFGGVIKGDISYTDATKTIQWLNSTTSGYAQLDGGANTFTTNATTAYKPGGGTWTAPSDERIKTVAGDYAAGLDEVLQLNPVVYAYKGNDTPTAELTVPPPSQRGEPAPPAEPVSSAPYPASMHYGPARDGTQFVGFVAQELEAVFPDMVHQTAGYIDGQPVADLRQVDVSNLIFALVNAVKTLKAEIDALRADAGLS
jgi:hypothetical protein